MFYVKAQAFNNTTLVLRNDLTWQGLGDFDFLLSDNLIEKVIKMLCSEVVKKHVQPFYSELTIELVKFGTDYVCECEIFHCHKI